MAEEKHQEESKLWHPDSPAHTKLLHATLQWENRRASAPPDTGSKPAWETFRRPTGEQISGTQYSHSHPWDKPEEATEQTDPPPCKKKKLNNKQGTEKEYAAEWVGCSECTAQGRRIKKLITVRTFSKQSLERKKGRQWVGDKLLPEIGQIVDDKAHLSQWATLKVKQHCKIEK
jgi:hypothetical protein